MRALAKALAIFLAGSAAALALVAVAKVGVVAALGASLYRLGDFELDHWRRLSASRPITRAPVLILGDSSAAFSIDALEFPDAMSFALVNSTSVEAYYLLKRVLDSGATPRCVLASFSFVWDANRKFFWPSFVASRFYSDEELAEIVAVSSGFGEAPGSEPALARTFRRAAAEARLLDDVTLPRLQLTIATKPWQGLIAESFRQNLWAHRGSSKFFDGSHFDGSLELTYPADPSMTRTEAGYFGKMLGLLGEHRIAFYLFEVPFGESVPKAVQSRFWGKLDSLLASVRGVGGAELRILRPPPVPAKDLISAGHLTAAGIQRIAPFLADALSPCYQ